MASQLRLYPQPLPSFEAWKLEKGVPMRKVRLYEVAAASLLPLLVGSCGPPRFDTEGMPAPSLREFDRIEIRPLILELSDATIPSERKEWAVAFSKEYRRPLYHRLRRSKVLDLPDGKLLIVEGKLLKYEWEQDSQDTQRSPSSLGSIAIELTFKDESGLQITHGHVSETGRGSSARLAMETTEKQVVSVVATFIRKSARRKDEPLPEAEGPGD